MNRKKYISLLALVMFLASPISDAKMTKETQALYQEACAYEYKGNYNSAI